MELYRLHSAGMKTAVLHDSTIKPAPLLSRLLAWLGKCS